MNITQSINEQYVENLLSTTNISVLQLPNKFTKIKLDMRARLFQVLTTLIDKYKIEHATIQNIDFFKNDDLIKKIEFLSCLSRMKKLTDTDSEKNLIKDYVINLKTFLLNMDSYENLPLTMKGPGFQIINFDWRDEFCYWKTIYKEKQFIEEEDFKKSFKKIILDTTKFNNNQIKIDSITEILYELYKNTHDHARSTSISDLSIRGFYTQKSLIKMNEIESYEAFKTYFENIKVYQKEGLEDLSFIELSVFDSGQGFYQTLKGTHPTHVEQNEEQQGTLECFEKYITSKGSTTYGRGLQSVLVNIAAHKGILVLRTGRMKITIDCSELKSDQFDIKDAKCEFYEYIKGTSLTIILPQSIEQGNLFS